MEIEMLTELPEAEVWQEWLSHPATRMLRQALRARRENLKEQLADGDFIDPVSSMLNVGVVAQCKLLKDILELDYELLIQEIDDYGNN